MAEEKSFSKYETARILGARALQISMDAPLLIKIKKEKLEEIKFDPLKIAEIEFEDKVLPITVKRPMPERKKEKLKEAKKKEIGKELSDAEKQKLEEAEEKRIKEEGEIMELSKPEEETEEETEKSEKKEI